MGFITLNWALGMMHVSLVMTLRATEPLFTLLLSAYLLKSERVSWNMGLSLLPVIFGAALSSAESAGISSGMPW
jgi:drug/metabolite transporter (DMT)-like permease